MNGQVHSLAALHLGKEPPVPMEKKGGGPLSLSGGEEKSLCENQTPVVHLVA